MASGPEFVERRCGTRSGGASVDHCCRPTMAHLDHGASGRAHRDSSLSRLVAMADWGVASRASATGLGMFGDDLVDMPRAQCLRFRIDVPGISRCHP